MALQINLVIPPALLVLLDRIADANELSAIQIKRIADELTAPQEDVTLIANQIESATEALHASQTDLSEAITDNQP